MTAEQEIMTVLENNNLGWVVFLLIQQNQILMRQKALLPTETNDR
jgi:hypothetical protein